MIPTLGRLTSRMRPLERHAWAAGLTFDGYGTLVGLRTSRASTLDALRLAVPPGARESDTPVVHRLYSLVVRDAEHGDRAAEPHELYAGPRCLARAVRLDPLIETLRSRLHFEVAVAARTRLFVHAGVVAWRGRAIVIPGRSCTGKSTLVAALVRAGATYYSDEYAVLDDGGLVHPFARPLGIRDATGRSHGVSPESLGATIGDAPLPIGLVVAARHQPGAVWRPAPMSRGEAVLALLDNTLAVRQRPADTLRILSAAVADAHALRGTRGEADPIAEYLLESLLPTSAPR